MEFKFKYQVQWNFISNARIKILFVQNSLGALNSCAIMIPVSPSLFPGIRYYVYFHITHNPLLKYLCLSLLNLFSRIMLYTRQITNCNHANIWARYINLYLFINTEGINSRRAKLSNENKMKIKLSIHRTKTYTHMSVFKTWEIIIYDASSRDLIVSWFTSIKQSMRNKNVIR